MRGGGSEELGDALDEHEGTAERMPVSAHE